MIDLDLGNDSVMTTGTAISFSSPLQLIKQTFSKWRHQTKAQASRIITLMVVPITHLDMITKIKKLIKEKKRILNASKYWNHWGAGVVLVMQVWEIGDKNLKLSPTHFISNIRHKYWYSLWALGRVSAWEFSGHANRDRHEPFLVFAGSYVWLLGKIKQKIKVKYG